MARFARFLKDDAGAITIDWVTITAGVLIVGIVVILAIYSQGVGPLVANMNKTLGTDLPTADKGEGVDCNTFNSC